MNFKNIAAIILLAFFIIISIQNAEVVPIHLLFWELKISKLLLIILTLIIGIFVGFMIPGLLKKPQPENKEEVK